MEADLPVADEPSNLDEWFDHIDGGRQGAETSPYV